jgi:hypothetical protein
VVSLRSFSKHDSDDRGVRQIGVDEVGFTESSISEVCAEELGASEVWFVHGERIEHSISEVGVGEIDAVETPSVAHLTKNDARQVGAGETGIDRQDNPQSGAVESFEDCEIALAGHSTVVIVS